MCRVCPMLIKSSLRVLNAGRSSGLAAQQSLMVWKIEWKIENGWDWFEKKKNRCNRKKTGHGNYYMYCRDETTSNWKFASANLVPFLNGYNYFTILVFARPMHRSNEALSNFNYLGIFADLFLNFRQDICILYVWYVICTLGISRYFFCD